MKKVLFSMVAMLLLSISGIAQTTYTMVNSASQLEQGQYILVGYDNDGQAFVMSYQKSNNRHAITIDEAGGVITATVATDPTQQDAPFEFTLGGSAGAWTIFDPLNNGYLNAPGGGNYLRTQSTLDDHGRWTITDGENGGMVPVSNGGEEQCYMRYNITSTLFGCYKESSNVAAPVYFFKAGGGCSDPDPEPSNYPTNFTATPEGVDVVVTWTDATGGQLPAGYLVRASIGNVDVPVDGTVYNNVNDKYVPQGNQIISFTGLQGGITYHFAIFPYTNSGECIDYKTDGNYPTAMANTEDIIYLLDEDFEGDDLGAFFAYDMYGEQSWHNATYSGNSYAYMNGYASGSAHKNVDWLISNVLDGGYQSITLQFRSAKNYTGEDLVLVISTNYDGVSEPSDFEWTEITNMFDWSSGGYEWVESGVMDITSFIGEHFYIAFVYESTDVEAAAWQVDDVKVIARNSLSVDENTQSIGLYPNPAREQVSFVLDDDAQVSIFDMTGRMVSMTECKAGQAQVDVNELVNGVYFVNFRFANGGTAVSKLVKF